MNHSYELPGGWSPLTPNLRPVFAWTRRLQSNPDMLELLWLSHHEFSSRDSLLEDLCTSIDRYDPVVELSGTAAQLDEDNLSLNSIAQLIPGKYHARIRDRDPVLLGQIRSMWQLPTKRQDHETIYGIFMEYGHGPRTLVDKVKQEHAETHWPTEVQLMAMDPFVEHPDYNMYWVAMPELNRQGGLCPHAIPYSANSIDPNRIVDELTEIRPEHAAQVRRITAEIAPAFATAEQVGTLIDARRANRMTYLLGVAMKIHEDDFTPPMYSPGVAISPRPPATE